MKQPDGWCAGSLGRECSPGLDLGGSSCCCFGKNTLLSKCLSPPGVSIGTDELLRKSEKMLGE